MYFCPGKVLLWYATGRLLLQAIPRCSHCRIFLLSIYNAVSQHCALVILWQIFLFARSNHILATFYLRWKPLIFIHCVPRKRELSISKVVCFTGLCIRPITPVCALSEARHRPEVRHRLPISAYWYLFWLTASFILIGGRSFNGTRLRSLWTNSE